MGQPDRLLGAVVLDASGSEVGIVAALRVDPGGVRARWLDVTLTDGVRAVVPAQAASTDGSGRLLVPFGLDDLRSAPAVEGEVVSTEVADALLRHYGFPPETR